MTDEDPVIFVIDDDLSMRATLSDVMRSVGLDVQTFASAQDFLGSKLPDAPACLVLDVRLPGQSGLDLHRVLRESGVELPVVFISGHSDVQMSVRAMKAGAVDFLAKPFRDQDLLDAVHEGVERDRARRGRAVKAAELQERYRSLTEREREIMALVVAGHPNKQTAGNLGLAEVTVKAHRQQIMHKMKARSLPELVRMATQTARCAGQGLTSSWRAHKPLVEGTLHPRTGRRSGGSTIARQFGWEGKGRGWCTHARPRGAGGDADDGSALCTWRTGNAAPGWRVHPVPEPIPRGAARPTALLLAPASAHPSRESMQKLAHELSLKADLDPEWAALPLALVEHEDRPALLLDDAGGEPLHRLIHGPMEPGRCMRLAAGIARALRELHARNLIHKDVKPANVLVDAETGKVRLMGFGIASRLRRERQAAEPPELIAGTLAYMAPEQTGRMNRSVDSRSDLYALGVTLYEMLTGSLPFTAADPMEWVHCHIAREAVPPHERCADVPPAVSAIVMKLLAKTPEERYQTAGGVEHDLRRCLASWEARGRIDAFRARRAGHAGPAGHSRKGSTVARTRSRPCSPPSSAWSAAARRSWCSYPAIRASASPRSSTSCTSALVPSRALFASGKFDQYKRDIPYSTLAQAFQGLDPPPSGEERCRTGALA